MKKRFCIFLIFAALLGCVTTHPVEALDTPDLFSGGSGTEEDPYLISTYEDFLNISTYLDKWYVQICDIDMTSMEDYSPIGSQETPFSGHYDGNGYKIKNFSYNDDESYVGLFSYSRGTICNIIMENSTINVHNKDHSIYCGSIIAYNAGSLLNCVSDANIFATNKCEGTSVYAGGICGYTTNTISDCEFSGSVEATVNYINGSAYAGGITAVGSVSDSCNDGTISAIGFSSCNAYAGGITGECYGRESQVFNCLNSGIVSATNARTAYAGGIVGAGSSVSCDNSGKIYAETKYGYSETYSGGVVGNGQAIFCRNMGNVDAFSTSSHVRVGGIIGNGSADDCKNYGFVSGLSERYEASVGGIVGRAGTIRRCANYGDVTMLNNGDYSCGMPGGVVGQLQYGTCLQCCNYGNITIEAAKFSSFSGGVAGGTNGTIVDCFNKGNVYIKYELDDPDGYNKNEANVGGVFSGNETSCSYCYNTGIIVSPCSGHQLGGIHANNGQESNTIEYCYALNAYDDTLAIVMTESQSTTKSTYKNYDFEDIWSIDPTINGGTPYLLTIPQDDNSNWYKSNGSVIAISGGFDGDQLTATVTSPANAILIAASYDSDGRQMNIDAVNINTACHRLNISTSLAKEKGITYKLFLVNKYSLSPLCDFWSTRS